MIDKLQLRSMTSLFLPTIKEQKSFEFHVTLATFMSNKLTYISQQSDRYILGMTFNPSSYITPFITLEEVLEIKKAFDLFDRDLGGAIDPKELKVAINSLGIEAKAQAVYQMIAELDTDGSGQIEFPEFFYMMTTRPNDNESRDQVHKIFITYDVSRTGFVGLKELRKVAKDLGELTDDTILRDMIEEADYNCDGVVSEEEFYNLLTKKTH